MKKAKFTVIDDVFGDISPPTQYTSNNSNNKTQSSSYNVKLEIYKAITDIYKSFQMTKTSQFDSFGVYKARVECYVCSDIRYIVAVVENDNDPIGTIKPLTELNWISFQTRMTKDQNEFKRFNMFARTYTLPPKSILNDRIKKIGETREKTVYETENLPLNVEILHISENDTFTDKGTIIAALELYQTVITFTE